MTVQRDGTERKVGVTPVKIKIRDPLGDEAEVWDIGARPFAPPIIGEVRPGLPAAAAGFRSGDQVVALEGQQISTWDDLAEAIHVRPGRPTRLDIKRGTESLTLTVTPNAEKERGPDGKETDVGRIGIGPSAASTLVRSNPVSALWEGMVKTEEVTRLTAVGLYKIATGQLDRRNIGGPIAIAAAAGEQARQGLPSLAFFTAVICVNLFLLNLLPIPMLDGGHLLFFACEAVLGRPLSLRKREVAQQVGLVLLMLLMVYAVYNDLDRIGLFKIFR